MVVVVVVPHCDGVTALLLIIPVVLLFWFFNLWLGR